MILRTKFQKFSGYNTPGPPIWEGVTVQCIHVWGRAPTGIFLATGLAGAQVKLV